MIDKKRKQKYDVVNNRFIFDNVLLLLTATPDGARKYALKI